MYIIEIVNNASRNIESLAWMDKSGILYRGSGSYPQSRQEPTIFTSRRRAEQAIKDTEKKYTGIMSWLNGIDFVIERLRFEGREI